MEPIAEYRQLLEAQRVLSVNHPLRRQVDRLVEELGNQTLLWSYNCIICRQTVTFEVTVGRANDWSAPPTGVCGRCAR
jgi:hypothetical protein